MLCDAGAWEKYAGGLKLVTCCTPENWFFWIAETPRGAPDVLIKENYVLITQCVIPL